MFLTMPHRPQRTAPSHCRARPRGSSLMAAGLILALLASIPACGPSRPRSVYPPPDTLRMAESQRHEFIHLFLQGRWCEAQGMFERSLEGFQLQDDFCGAAHNHLIAWKLHQYLQLDAEHHLVAARKLTATGLSCPALHLPGAAADHEPAQEEHLGPADQAYRELIRQGAFTTLANRLRAESDPLFASVYGRKAARAALGQGAMEPARTLMHQTRELDAAQGWIVFLIQDWTILLEMTAHPDRRQDMARRIALLQARIQPCSM